MNPSDPVDQPDLKMPARRVRRSDALFASLKRARHIQLVSLLVFALAGFFSVVVYDSRHYIAGLSIILIAYTTLMWAFFRYYLGPERRQAVSEFLEIADAEQLVGFKRFDHANLARTTRIAIAASLAKRLAEMDSSARAEFALRHESSLHKSLNLILWRQEKTNDHPEICISLLDALGAAASPSSRHIVRWVAAHTLCPEIRAAAQSCLDRLANREEDLRHTSLRSSMSPNGIGIELLRPVTAPDSQDDSQLVRPSESISDVATTVNEKKLDMD